MSDDFFNEHTSTLGHTVHGRDAYRERLPQFLREFNALRYEVEGLVVDGSDAALAYRMTCRWQEHPVCIRGVFWFEVRDDVIAHRVDYWDSAEFRRQTQQR